MFPLFPILDFANDKNTQIGYIGPFEMINKNLTMEDITVIFKKILKEHKASIVQKNQKMLHKQEQFIIVSISGNNSLTNQPLDSLSKYTNDLKKNL